MLILWCSPGVISEDFYTKMLKSTRLTLKLISKYFNNWFCNSIKIPHTMIKNTGLCACDITTSFGLASFVKYQSF